MNNQNIKIVPIEELSPLLLGLINDGTDVVFTVTEKQLRFWNFDCNEISEPGDFELSAGYADHLLLTRRFALKA